MGDDVGDDVGLVVGDTVGDTVGAPVVLVGAPVLIVGEDVWTASTVLVVGLDVTAAPVLIVGEDVWTASTVLVVGLDVTTACSVVVVGEEVWTPSSTVLAVGDEVITTVCSVVVVGEELATTVSTVGAAALSPCCVISSAVPGHMAVGATSQHSPACSHRRPFLPSVPRASHTCSTHNVGGTSGVSLSHTPPNSLPSMKTSAPCSPPSEWPYCPAHVRHRGDGIRLAVFEHVAVGGGQCGQQRRVRAPRVGARQLRRPPRHLQEGLLKEINCDFQYGP